MLFYSVNDSREKKNKIMNVSFFHFILKIYSYFIFVTNCKHIQHFFKDQHALF